MDFLLLVSPTLADALRPSHASCKAYLPHNLAPPLDLGIDERLQLLARRTCGGEHTEHEDLLLNFLRREHCFQLGMKSHDDLVWGGCRCHQHAPASRVEAGNTRLCDRGNLGCSRPAGRRRYPERPHVS